MSRRGEPAPRSATARALRSALGVVVALVLAIAALEVAAYPSLGGSLWLLGSFTGVGVVYALTGVVAWDRRPGNRMGALLVLGGLSILLAAAGNAPLPLLERAGEYVARLPLAVIAHLLLAFPSGRLRDAVPRLVVGAAYATALSVHALQIRSDDAERWAQVWELASPVFIILTAAILLARAQAASPHQRRTLLPLYGYGTFAMLSTTFSARVLPELIGAGPFLVFGLQQLVLTGVPIAFLIGILGGGFRRTQELDELAAWLSTADDARPSLREALARALGDPTVDLWFWLPEEGRHVDAAGAPAADSGRPFEVVELRGEPVGAIVYDDDLIAEPDAVRRAGRVVAVALDRERLTASLQAEQRALAESRRRLAAASDQERRRIARDLHDGVQSRLVALAMRAGRMAAAPTSPPEVVSEAGVLRTEAEKSLDELRALVQGLMPALLFERGLDAATEDLVDRLPLPTDLELGADLDALPDEVESTAYFVVAEALTNAVKHAGASRLNVRLARENGVLAIEVRDDGRGGAAGLDRLRDRVDAHGGRLVVDSSAGAGTLIRAELPCAS